MSNNLVTTGTEWDTLQRQAKAFLASGYLREEFIKGVDKNVAIAKVATIITMGDELGIGRMQALRSINVIKGKPALAAELMLALCFKKIPGFKATFTTPPDQQHLECSLTLQRPGGDPNEFKFTVDDAKKAGIYKLDSAWTKYPKAMLRARAISEGIRAVAPDATMGMMTLEELGQEVVDAEVVEVEKPKNEKQVEEPAPIEQPKQMKKPTGNTVSYDRRHNEKMSQPSTPKQQKALHSIATAAEWTDEDFKSYLLDTYDTEHTADLTKAQASDMFDMFKAEYPELFQENKNAS